MNKKLKYQILVKVGIFITLTASIYSCLELELEKQIRIEIDSIHSFNPKSVIVSAEIIDAGNGIVQHGYCWGTIHNPTIESNHAKLGERYRPANFSYELSDLSPSTTYYIKAYAFNGNTYYYTTEKSFRTADVGQPIISTGTLNFIGDKFYMTGNITSLGNGRDSILDYGHCWSKNMNPTISESHSGFGTLKETTEFTSLLHDVQKGDDYYVRAYGKLDGSLIYGDQILIRTDNDLPLIQINDILSVTSSEFSYNINIISDGGSEILENGICVSVYENPIRDIYSIVLDNNTGVHSGKIDNLKRATAYYIRAYSINNNGISYSNQIKIMTYPEIPSIEIQASTTTSHSAEIKLEHNNGGEQYLDIGLYYGTSPEQVSSGHYKDLSALLSNSEFSIENLEEYTTYYIQAYARNSIGASYSEVLELNTKTLQGSITDSRDNKTYATVKIGNQWWMAENLNYEHEDMLIRPIYKTNINTTYYLEYIIDNNLCPNGWHLPNKNDWNLLIEFLGGEEVAGGKLRVHGSGIWEEEVISTPETGFDALPYGYYHELYSPDELVNFVTNTADFIEYNNSSSISIWRVVGDSTSIRNITIDDDGYYPVRCIKD